MNRLTSERIASFRDVFRAPGMADPTCEWRAKVVVSRTSTGASFGSESEERLVSPCCRYLDGFIGRHEVRFEEGDPDDDGSVSAA